MYYISVRCPFGLRWLEPSFHGTLNKRDLTTTCPHLETTTTVFRFLCHISSNSTTLEVNEDWSLYFCFFPIPVAEWTEQKYLVSKGRRKQKAQVSITKQHIAHTWQHKATPLVSGKAWQGYSFFNEEREKKKRGGNLGQKV